MLPKATQESRTTTDGEYWQKTVHAASSMDVEKQMEGRELLRYCNDTTPLREQTPKLVEILSGDDWGWTAREASRVTLA